MTGGRSGGKKEVLIMKKVRLGIIGLGSGDFSIFVEPEGEYIYLFYNIVRADMKISMWDSCDVYVARTRKRTDGVMGDFVKYYEGSFCEAGNFGRETMVVEKIWHPRVLYSQKYNKYFLSGITMRTSSSFRPNSSSRYVT